MISTLPGSHDFWNSARIYLVRSREPSSEAISFQFLNVCPSSEASCWVRKRSPLSVQRRIVTAGLAADGKRRGLQAGKKRPLARGDEAFPDTIPIPQFLRLQHEKLRNLPAAT